MFEFQKKLQYHNSQIKLWNQNVFCNIFDEKDMVSKGLDKVHENIILHVLYESSYENKKQL